MKEQKTNTYKWGIFLRLHVTTIEKNEERMRKLIRYCKEKYKVKEYMGCMEKSKGGYIHNHIYLDKYIPIKEINRKWKELNINIEESKEDIKDRIEIEERNEDIIKRNEEIIKKIIKEMRNEVYVGKVESEKHKENIIAYIRKEATRIIESKFKNTKSEKKETENRGDISEIKRKVAVKAESVVKRIRGERGLKKEESVYAEHRSESEIIFKKQKDLEKELIVLKSIEDLRKKGGRNYKQNIIVLRELINYIKPYVMYEYISKKMSNKTKEIMLLNMVYIGLQLQNCRKEEYLHYKIGEKLFKYYDLNNQWIKKIIESNIDSIKDIKKITKKEWKEIYKKFYKTESYKVYKEQLIQIGIKHYNLFEQVFYNIKEILYKDKIVQKLEIKKEIQEKIKKIIDIGKIKKYKYKIPLIEKPIEWGPEEKDWGGWHTVELRKAIVKENINEGHELVINYKRIYAIINKLQSIEYKINKEWLEFILQNKEKIYEILLIDAEKGTKAYITKKEQFDITIDIAQYMSKYEKFYFTYELDYRGRLYPQQEYLNYQGNLLARSIIQWYNGKQKYGYFLKISCVSLYQGILNKNYREVWNIYQKEFLNLDFDSNWYELAKKAKEPILWLNLFFELKKNLKKTTNYIIWFDATSSGSQLLSLFVNDREFRKELNLYDDNKINDYYLAIYNKYGKLPGIKEEHARKIVKKVIMTINYGLTIIGCHRYFYSKLKELKYCKNKEEYKEKWKNEVIKFYKFVLDLSLVKSLNELQELWELLVKINYTYEFVIGSSGIMVKKYNNGLKDYIFKSKTYCYKKYYKNLSLYNKSRKMKEKGFKYLWHHKNLDKREQYRKIKANLIHMLDATWNILTCEKFQHDIATIHDCHGIHSYDVIEWFEDVKTVLVKMFEFNKYFYLLEEMLEIYHEKTYKVNEKLYKDMYKKIIKYEPLFTHETPEWWKIRSSKYMFVPK